MKVINALLFFFLLFEGVAIASDQERSVKRNTADTSGYRALIVGISEYAHADIPDLKTPRHDAEELAKVLRQEYSFQVRTLLDGEATWKGIDGALHQLVADSRSGDSVLLYFAGHGDFDTALGQGWWFPSDAVKGDKKSYYANHLVRDIMKHLQARHVLLISDSCFAASFFAQNRAVSPAVGERYYAELFKSKSRMGITSGGKEPVMDGGSEGHSVFAYYFLKSLQEPEREVFSAGELFRRIAQPVTNNSRQKPVFLPVFDTGHDLGEFVFVRHGADMSKLSYIPPPPVDAPLTNWQYVVGGGFVAMAGGATLCFFLVVKPRTLRRQQRIEIEAAIARRDLSRLHSLSKDRHDLPDDMTAALEASMRQVDAICLENDSRKILISPAERQGLGRGSDWVFSLDDPHVSRRPHAWISCEKGEFWLSADGGEIVVAGEQIEKSWLGEEMNFSLGPLTRLRVSILHPGKLLVLEVTSGPSSGREFVVCSGEVPLASLTGIAFNFGTLCWQRGRPLIIVDEKAQNPLGTDSPRGEVLLYDGDRLSIGGVVWRVVFQYQGGRGLR